MAGPADRHLYTRPATGTLGVIDISTPDAPVLLAEGTIGFSSYSSYLTTTVSDQYMYAVSYDGSNLAIIESYRIFEDLPWENWAADAVLTCVKAAIVGGYPDGVYLPDAPVTRDQMAVFVARALTGGDELVPSAPPTPTFSDVPADHWAYQYVEYAAAQNIVGGYEGDLYEPSWNVTRGQMAVFIARALVAPSGDAGVSAGPTEPTFPDVTSANAWSWCYNHVEHIAGLGVTQGYFDDLYHPEYVCARDQMAVFVARAFGLSF